MTVEHLKKVLPQGIRRPLGVIRRRLRARQSLTRRQKEKLLTSPRLATDDREILARVDSRIFHEDGMYAGDGDHYFRVGLSAIHCIDTALSQAQIQSPRRILDLPCGGGRVLRFLAARFPEAELTVCDLQPDLVDFCARQFDGTAVYSKENLNDLSFDDRFDLIWCGSLATHLDAAKIREMLELFDRSLSSAGLVVFTTNGDHAIQRMRDGEMNYGVSREAIRKLVDSYQETGYGFAPYPNVSEYGVSPAAGGYGISATAPEWIRSQIRAMKRWTEVYFSAHGWDNHQDVFGFIRRANQAIDPKD